MFGGFGTGDLFPSLHYLEMDGIYFDKVKICRETTLNIERGGKLADIVPFAQQEMVQRFIYGIDVDVEDDVTSFVRDAVNSIIDALPLQLDQREREELNASLENSFAGMMGRLKGKTRRNVLEMVHFMTKKELAEMAHALVELTSRKRRFSSEQESVGGPIDVAVITKSEGFIWIRRKHYFERAENPAFFARMQAQLGRGPHEDKSNRPEQQEAVPPAQAAQA